MIHLMNTDLVTQQNTLLAIRKERERKKELQFRDLNKHNSIMSFLPDIRTKNMENAGRVKCREKESGKKKRKEKNGEGKVVRSGRERRGRKSKGKKEGERKEGGIKENRGKDDRRNVDGKEMNSPTNPS